MSRSSVAATLQPDSRCTIVARHDPRRRRLFPNAKYEDVLFS
ncbi:MAG: hypothetical protein WCC84_13880 [Candidatus Cybelea sp.]